MATATETLECSAEDIERQNEEYKHKASHLEALIRHATGNDISSFPSDIMDPLSVLARIATILYLDDFSVPAYASAFSRLSSEHLEMQEGIIQFEKAERDLMRSIDVAKYKQRLAESWLSSTEQLQAETSDLERQKKAMNAKAKEYQEELATIMSNSPAAQDECPSITSLLSFQDSLHEKERKLKVLKGRLQAFQGLPPNVELAKQQLQIARNNQIRLMNIRDKLLGRMNLGLN